jgi:hypothetical protein
MGKKEAIMHTTSVVVTTKKINRTKKTPIVLPEIALPDLAIGDEKLARQKLYKAGILGKIVHKDKQGRHEILNTSEIFPLDSQRDAKISWALKCLETRGGFDLGAAGVICVVKEHNKYYAWDGLGRLTQALLMGITEVDCWVYDGTQAEAAEYFVYNQKDGKRSLTNEQIFINEVACGDPSSLIEVGQLQEIGLSIKGSVLSTYPAGSTDPNVKYNAFKKALSISGNDTELVKQARDMIVSAYPADEYVGAELLTGLTLLLATYPESRKNGIHKALNDYLKAMALTYKQKKLPFKEAGGNVHNDEPRSVAYGFLKLAHGSPFMSASFKQRTPITKLKEE